MPTTHPLIGLSRVDVLDVYASIVPMPLLRPVAVAIGTALELEAPFDPFTALTGRPRTEVTRRVVAALATARGEKVCTRCGGAGVYGHHGVCFDCGGRRTVAA